MIYLLHLFQNTAFGINGAGFYRPDGWLVGWEINVPFQHKNRVYQGQGLGWRFISDRLKMEMIQ